MSKFKFAIVISSILFFAHCSFLQGLLGIDDDSNDDQRTLGLLALLAGPGVDSWEVFPSTNPLFYASVEKTECKSIVDATIRCGYIHVPRDREISTDNTMRIAFAVLPRALGVRTSAAVVHLGGSPGNGLGLASNFYKGRFQEVNRDFDVIVLDMRGVRFSDEPDCDTGALLTCFNTEVSAGRSPTGYTFKQTAYDTQALRMALGYENIHIHGQSLGTQLAQAVLKYDDTKNNVLSIALTGPRHINNIAANIGTTAQINADFQNSFDLWNSQCAANAVCSSLLSPQNFQTFYNSVLSNFQNNPRILGLTQDTRLVLLEKKTSAFTGAITITQSGGNWIVKEGSSTIHTASAGTYKSLFVFTDAFFNELNIFDIGDVYPHWPFVLKKWMEDDATAYNNLAAGLERVLANASTTSTGNGNLSNFLIGCYEEGPGATVNDVLCPAGHPQATAAELTAPTANVPVLILNGFHDRATSPYRAGTLDAQLPNSYLTTLMYRGHNIGNDICAQETMRAFFLNPNNYVPPACVAIHNAAGIQFVADYPTEIPQ